MRRRRYDTDALVREIRRERRNAILLSIAGATILGSLAGLYFLSVGGNGVPMVPKDIGAAPTDIQTTSKPGTPLVKDAKAETPLTADPKAASPEVPKPPPEAQDQAKKPPAEPQNALVEVTLTRKARLWVNGKAVGRVRKHRATLKPGQNTLKAKFGRRTVMRRLNLKPGAEVAVRFDAKRKKAFVKSKL